MEEVLQKKKRKVILCLALLSAVLIWGCGRTDLEKEFTENDAEAAAENMVSDSRMPDRESGGEGAEGELEETSESEDIRPEGTRSEDEVSENLKSENPEEEIERPKVKGIFVTGPMAGTSNMDNLIALVEETELNAIVLDVKNDEGRIVYDMQIPAVQDTGADINYIRDMEALIEKCKEKNIYLIARIVAFKDPYLAEAKPEWCVHNSDGSIFRDKGGLAWLNPYEHQVWEYLLDIAQEALRMGFDEVQFDYIRFSTDSGMKNADFGQAAGEKDRQQIITEFVKYASERVHEAGGAISADVYGMVIDSEVDQQIVGQNYVEMSRYLDYISPMVYPSHYGPYNYNIPIPDAEPYNLVLAAMQSSRKVLAGIPVKTVSGNMEPELTAEEIAALAPMENIRAKVRPWLQDFTAAWVAGHISYGPEEIRAQIQAVYDAGYEEWILWNASNRYTEGGLIGKDELKEE